MLGMDKAAERLRRAIANREQILIYGDYDVDGTTAIVILKTAIELCGGGERHEADRDQRVAVADHPRIEQPEQQERNRDRFQGVGLRGRPREQSDSDL